MNSSWSYIIDGMKYVGCYGSLILTGFIMVALTYVDKESGKVVRLSSKSKIADEIESKRTHN